MARELEKDEHKGFRVGDLVTDTHQGTGRPVGRITRIWRPTPTGQFSVDILWDPPGYNVFLPIKGRIYPEWIRHLTPRQQREYLKKTQE